MKKKEIERLLNKKIAVHIDYFSDGKKIRQYTDIVRRKDFLNNLGEDFKYEICYKKPEKFQMNVVYIRADGKFVFINGMVDKNNCST